jgi:hypothetical protein
VGLAVLAGGLGLLCAAATLVACCLRLRSPLELVLAAYVLAWAWLVALVLVLSPAQVLTRATLVAGLGMALVGALGAWHVAGRPPPPPLRPALRNARLALRRPVLAILALAVAAGLAYSSALALYTPVNEGDALAYHLARAAFWHQEHGVGYVVDTVDVRLNGNPPNAEIGQLATMLLARSDRYVALPQLLAYGALVLSVAAIARRVGLGVAEAIFGALAFATLPVATVQASGALNDLVVASFLAIAVVFALRPGRASLVLFALALALALGTKLTALLAVPTLALVVLLGRSRRDRLGLVVAGAGGVVLGSAWYFVNLAETGELDGGLAEAFDQRADSSPPAVVVNALRLALDVVDMSGAARPHALLFVAAAAALALLGLMRLRRSRAEGGALLAGALLTALPYFAEEVVTAGQRVVFKAWLVLGEPDTAPFDEGWGLNVDADPVDAWFGPLGAVFLVLGTGAVILLWRRSALPLAGVGLALAPWLLLVSLAVTIVWDPWRGRFLIFGVALAAASWGALLRYRALAVSTAAIGTTAVALALANYQGKPSGLGSLWASGDPPPPAVHAVWNDERWTVQAWLRPGDEGEDVLLQFVQERIPADAHVAVATRENDFLSPYFGARLSREISLVRDGEGVAEAAEWLVLSPRSAVERCSDSWAPALTLPSGWRVERRLAADACRETA